MNKNVRLFVVSFILFLFHFGFSFPQESQLSWIGSEKFRLYQTALGVGNSVSVLFLSLRPGYEDMAAIAFFKFGKGAKVFTAYITNGEAGESDSQSKYPNELAAALRKEASQVGLNLKSESFFLNIPDPGSASDTGKVWRAWNRDTLRLRLMRMFSEFRPDIVVLSGDRSAENPSYAWDAVREGALEALKRLQPPRTKRELNKSEGIQFWSVQRFFAESQSGKGLTVKVKSRDPLLKRNYQSIGTELSSLYETQNRQRAFWKQPDSLRYTLEFSAGKRNVAGFEDGLPLPVSRKFQWIDENVRNLSKDVLRDLARIVPGGSVARRHLARLVTIMDSVDIRITRGFKDLPAGDRKLVLLWKEGLQSLRNRLLGVDVQYQFSETILTNIQLTHLIIDTVKGMHDPGALQLVFPSVREGWILNEKSEQQVNLIVNEQYRFISPAAVPYHLPAQIEGLQYHRVTKPVAFYVVYATKSKATSFVETVTTPFRFAPKFTVEVLTPLVRANKSDEVVVRLTNHSRDGVGDVLTVRDSLVHSNGVRFRLSFKESSHLDTLRLHWNKEVAAESYLVPLSIGEINVGQFAARSFEAAVDTTRKLGLLTTLSPSGTEQALRRLGARFERLDPHKVSLESLQIFDVVILDRRFTTLHRDVLGLKAALNRFVEQGGHLLILSQDPWGWNPDPLWGELSLRSSTVLDERTPVSVDTTHRLLVTPNKIKPSDWDDWLWHRGRNFVTTKNTPGVEVPVRNSRDGGPLVLTSKQGRGRLTYVDLAFEPQWMNIHGGAFRLFANLLSY